MVSCNHHSILTQSYLILAALEEVSEVVKDVEESSKTLVSVIVTFLYFNFYAESTFVFSIV